jgi:hypothetical protein
MKHVLFLFLICCSYLCVGQSISAPAPISIEANATNVDAGDFVITWPSAPTNILVSVSLEYQSGAILSFPTTSGLTLNTGYTTWNSITSIVFYGSLANINTALAAMTVSMGSVKTAIKINLEVSSYDANYYYNPTNKHFYKYVASSAVSYASAKSGASGNTFKGKTGYLVTVTSQSEQDFLNNNIVGNNIWIALTDITTEGTWKIDAGPELGTTIKTQNGQTAGNITGQYNNWCGGEPNDSNNEDYAVTKWGGGTCWNDVNGTNSSVAGYIVEISDDFPAGADYTDVYISYIVHNNEFAYTLSSATSISSSSISNLQNLSGGLSINNSHTITLPDKTIIKSNKIIFNGTGKLVLSTSNSKWSPENSSANNTIVYSPSVNTNPISWSSSGAFAGNSFYANAPYYSSVNGYHYTPWIGSPQGWSSVALDVNQYITLNYPIPAYIAGVVTQGRQNDPQWVKYADIEVSLNGINDWTNVLTNTALNTDQNTLITTLFSTPIYAKYVRVKTTRTTDWNGHATLRLGLLVKSYLPNIITNGLRIRLDAAESSSYAGSGTTWNDIGSNAFPFTLVNGPTYNAAGYFDFDGSNDYAIISHTAALKPTTGITTEQWISADNWAAGTSGSDFKCSLSCTEGGGYSNNIWSNTFSSYLWAGGAYRVPTASVSGFTGWHHFVTTFDGRFVRLYVDSQIKSTVDVGSVNNVIGYNNSNSIIIGGEASGSTTPSGSYWDGKIGTTLIYNRALTAAEVLQNYNNTKSKFGL